MQTLRLCARSWPAAAQLRGICTCGRKGSHRETQTLPNTEIGEVVVVVVVVVVMVVVAIVVVVVVVVVVVAAAAAAGAAAVVVVIVQEILTIMVLSRRWILSSLSHQNHRFHQLQSLYCASFLCSTVVCLSSAGGGGVIKVSTASSKTIGPAGVVGVHPLVAGLAARGIHAFPEWTNYTRSHLSRLGLRACGVQGCAGGTT